MRTLVVVASRGKAGEGGWGGLGCGGGFRCGTANALFHEASRGNRAYELFYFVYLIDLGLGSTYYAPDLLNSVSPVG